MTSNDRPTSGGIRGHAREALLEAAVHCITTRGFAATTQRDLIARSGANPRSIGYHFGGKDQLMMAGLVEAFRRRSVTVFRAAAEGGRPGPARLADALQALLESFRAEPDAAYALAEAVAQTRSAPLRATLAQHYAELRGTFAALLDDELGADLRAAGADATALASAFLALFDGFVLQWLVEPAAVPEPGAVVLALTTAFRAAR